MEKYYIIREDGSSIFELSYPKDFCIHCLCLLIEDGQKYRLMSFADFTPLPCQQFRNLIIAPPKARKQSLLNV